MVTKRVKIDQNITYESIFSIFKMLDKICFPGKQQTN